MDQYFELIKHTNTRNVDRHKNEPKSTLIEVNIHIDTFSPTHTYSQLGLIVRKSCPIVNIYIRVNYDT